MPNLDDDFRHMLGSVSAVEARFACGDSAIDWQAAAPSWGAILVRAVLPIIGAFVAFGLVCWLISGSSSTFLAFCLGSIVCALGLAACLKAASIAVSAKALR
jgi:hypothetical protein